MMAQKNWKPSQFGRNLMLVGLGHNAIHCHGVLYSSKLLGGGLFCP